MRQVPSLVSSHRIDQEIGIERNRKGQGYPQRGVRLSLTGSVESGFSLTCLGASAFAFSCRVLVLFLCQLAFMSAVERLAMVVGAAACSLLLTDSTGMIALFTTCVHYLTSHNRLDPTTEPNEHVAAKTTRPAEERENADLGAKTETNDALCSLRRRRAVGSRLRT